MNVCTYLPAGVPILYSLSARQFVEIKTLRIRLIL